MPLTSADRARLARILELLGSDHAGERDAAALAAHKLVKSKGLAWAEVLAEEPAWISRLGPSRAYPAPAAPNYDWQADFRLCVKGSEWLTRAEALFVRTLSGRLSLTEEWAAKLAKIANRLRASGEFGDAA